MKYVDNVCGSSFSGMERKGDTDINRSCWTWNWGNSRSGKELKPSKIKFGLNEQEHFGKSWKPEETCCHVNFS